MEINEATFPTGCWVALYEATSTYGGPAEGGWYYTRKEVYPTSVRYFTPSQLADARAYALHLANDVARARSRGSDVWDTVDVSLLTPRRVLPESVPRYC